MYLAEFSACGFLSASKLAYVLLSCEAFWLLVSIVCAVVVAVVFAYLCCTLFRFLAKS